MSSLLCAVLPKFQCQLPFLMPRNKGMQGIESEGGMTGEYGVWWEWIKGELGALWVNECKVNMGCDGGIQGRHREWRGKARGSGWRVKVGGWQRKPWIPTHLGQYAITYVIVTTCGSPKVSMPATPLMPSDKVMQGRNREWRGNATWVWDMMGEWMKGEHGAWWVN